LTAYNVNTSSVVFQIMKSGSIEVGGVQVISDTGNLTPSDGVTGSWTTVDGKTITATNGIITGIV